MPLFLRGGALADLRAPRLTCSWAAGGTASWTSWLAGGGPTGRDPAPSRHPPARPQERRHPILSIDQSVQTVLLCNFSADHLVSSY